MGKNSIIFLALQAESVTYPYRTIRNDTVYGMCQWMVTIPPEEITSGRSLTIAMPPSNSPVILPYHRTM